MFFYLFVYLFVYLINYFPIILLYRTTEGGVLEGAEVLAMVPLAVGRVAQFPLRPSKNQPCVLRVQTHVASRLMSSQLHVFESEVSIPRFAGYQVVEDGQGGIEPNSQVTVRVNESVSRFAGWVSSGFILPHPMQGLGDKMKICFVSVCRPKKVSSLQTGESSPSHPLSLSFIPSNIAL